MRLCLGCKGRLLQFGYDVHYTIWDLTKFVFNNEETVQVQKCLGYFLIRDLFSIFIT